MQLDTHRPYTMDVGEEKPIELGLKRLELDELIELRAKHREIQRFEKSQKAKAKAKKDDDDDADLESADLLWLPLLKQAFQHVRIDSTVVVGGVKLDKGEQLIKFFGGRPVDLILVFFALLAQNSIDDKKKWSSPSPTDSPLSSEEQSPEAPGPKPETIAESAASEGSADSEAVTSPANPPYGSTDHEEKAESPSMSSMSAPSLA